MALYELLYLAGIDFSLQWILWFFSAWLHTEKFYDLAGSSTFILLSSLCYNKFSNGHIRSKIQTAAVIFWASRLGLFLFTRILKDGQDKRFNKARDDPKLLFIYWTLQGLWVIVTLLPTLMMVLEKKNTSLSFQDWLGWGMWIVGFTIEVLADYQKGQFRADPANKGKFINTGLWSISRHPNYFGEILLWFGLFVSASSVYSKWWQYLSILSPTFVYLLITKVSGIPSLERFGQQRWGTTVEYQNYVRDTPVLIPFL